MSFRRMLIVEDDSLCVRTWQRIFLLEGWEVVIAGTLWETREAMNDPAGFDVVLLDVRLPDGRGVDLVGELNALRPKPRIVVVSGEVDASIALEVFGMVDALVPKPVPNDVILGLVSQVSRDVPAWQIARFTEYHGLSAKESQLLQLVAEGKSNAEARATLGCNPSTEQTYWKRIKKKTGAHSPRDVIVLLWQFSRHGQVVPAFEERLPIDELMDKSVAADKN